MASTPRYNQEQKQSPPANRQAVPLEEPDQRKSCETHRRVGTVRPTRRKRSKGTQDKRTGHQSHRIRRFKNLASGTHHKTTRGADNITDAVRVFNPLRKVEP